MTQKHYVRRWPFLLQVLVSRQLVDSWLPLVLCRHKQSVLLKSSDARWKSTVSGSECCGQLDSCQASCIAYRHVADGMFHRRYVLSHPCPSFTPSSPVTRKKCQPVSKRKLCSRRVLGMKTSKSLAFKRYCQISAPPRPFQWTRCGPSLRKWETQTGRSQPKRWFSYCRLDRPPYCVK